jgi:hypothetical protein
MSFTGLVDSWHASRQERTRMGYGERVHSVEKAIKGRMPTRDRGRRERRDHRREMRRESSRGRER